MDGAGILWLVATPIGSLGDLGARAAEVLDAVDLILAEDTRRARVLLRHAGIEPRRRLRSLHEHNELRLVEGVVAELAAGRQVALVSDAGTPLLSDPGYPLVRRALEEGLRVCSVPGPSAFTAALAASGQPPLPATLVGFLPPRAAARRRRIAELAAVPWTVVILLSPHRLGDELADLARGLGDGRPATLLAEISKRHERSLRGPLAELAASREVAAPRGEYVLVVAPRASAEAASGAPDEEVRACYREALERGADPRRALKETVSATGRPRREVYRIVHARSGSRSVP